MKAILKGVGKRYGDQWVLRDLNLTLEGANVLMAPSGRGKTTLARLLLGLEEPDAGSLAVDGRIVATGDGSLVSKINTEGYEAFLEGAAGREEAQP